MSDLLIDAVTLKGTLSEPGLVVFDVRCDLSDPEHGRRAYLDGHVPGARFLDQGDDLAGQPDGSNGRHPLPDRQQLARVLQRCGVTHDSRIVIYDQGNASFAARAWWLIRWMGYSKVCILDGGLKAWLEAGGQLQAGDVLSPEQTEVQEGGVVDMTLEPAMPTVTAADILTRDSRLTRRLVDARTAERYLGRNEPMDPVAGRIEDALNRPIAMNVMADGRFKSPQQLRDEFTDLLGSETGNDVTHYCGSGITACHNVFAMELAGLSGSALYPGSWSEWCSDPARPVARG